MIPSAWLLLLLLAPRVEQWRLVYADGRVGAVAGRPAVTQEESGKILAAWAWSGGTAPRRLGAEAVGSFSLPRDEARLQLRIHGQDRGSYRDLAVVAGPAPMWLEVPEPLLPTWRVPARGMLEIPWQPGEAWRLRLVGDALGSWWMEVPPGRREVTLVPRPAADRRWAVMGEGGEPVAATLVLFPLDSRRGGARPWARFSGQNGVCEVLGLPDSREVRLVITAPGHVPRSLSGWPGLLPAEVQLGRGTTVTGRLLSEEGRPVAGARIQLEAYVAPEGLELQRRSAEAGEDGRWRLEAVARGKAVVRGEAPGLAAFERVLEIAEDPLDLGEIVLPKGTAVTVQVRDDEGSPVAGAEVEIRGSTALTDHRGSARLTGLPRGEALTVAARARAHLPAVIRLEPPFPDPLQIEIHRAFVLVGRLVDGEGAPVGDGAVRIGDATSFRDEPLAPDGRFELDLQPGRGFELVLRSPTTRALALEVEPGFPGEVRDVGDLQAPSGLIVRGRVIDGRDGSPVPDARIWTPRPSAQGPLLAWVHRDLLQTRSDPEGTFVLAGLAPIPTELRLEAADYAPRRVALRPEPEAEALELGDVELQPGATVRVRVEGVDSEAARARLDLGNAWQEIDMLTAAVYHGWAVFRQVPPGPATLSVVEGRSLLCEAGVDVPAGEAELEVACARNAMRVVGRVEVGGGPAGPGRLLWLPPAPVSPSAIMTHESPGGLRRQQVFGAGRPQVDVPVTADGWFVSEDLTPGAWEVAWFPESGGVTPSLAVELPRREEFEILLRFAGWNLHGLVLDDQGQPAAGARVQDLGSGALAFADAEGRFRLSGLDPGVRHVRAEKGRHSSPTATVEILPDSDPDPLVLRLGEAGQEVLAIQILDHLREPAAGAFVFLEGADGRQRLLTADASGRASIRLDPPYPDQIRLAAYAVGAWTLGPWLPFDPTRVEPATLALGPTGSLAVHSEGRGGALALLSASGWDMAWLLTRLGLRPTLSPGGELVLHGLPEGVFSVALDGPPRQVSVAAGEQAAVDLD